MNYPLVNNADKHAMDGVQTLLQEGIRLAKCRKCGCMVEALGSISFSLRSPRTDEFAGLRENVEVWLKQMQPAEYA